jgi:UDP-N-acetylglucosamine--N-acetylmuramyl-(pentapeptide) pyrophosphoryl-undecaprenol N-acetylglucosamine transferase
MKIIIAAGGTGGHVFPGIALAEAFTRENGNNQLLFIGTKRALERKTIIPRGYAFEAIDTTGIKGKNPLTMVRALLQTIKGVFQSIMIIKHFAPDLVIGLGGYVSGPPVLAACLMGVKTAIHEQNSIPGFTNRILGKIAHRIFISFNYSRSYFPPGKTVLTGTPLSREHLQASHVSSPGSPFTLLILGGSLGSRQINGAITDALEDLLPLKDTLSLIHQTGPQEVELVKAAYHKRGFSAEVVPFIDHIAGAYQRAHLIISRAGATTLAELMVHHKASILIPYPLAADHHQHLNARILVDHKAALMIDPDDLTGRRLAELIIDLYHHPEQRAAMEENAGSLGRPHAAQAIIDHCCKLVA